MTKHKILVISDSHGEDHKIGEVLKKETGINAIIHCGDGARDMTYVHIPEGVQVTRVIGNVDQYSVYGVEEEVLEEIEGKTVYITHGHLHNVKNTLSKIQTVGKEYKADIVFFGHTHEPTVIEGNPILFNPGALALNSYGIVTVDDSGNWEFGHKVL